VQIDVRSVTNFAADRNWVIQIQGLPSMVAPPTRDLIVDVPITIQQGTASQTFVRYIPRWAITRGIRVQVLEEGRVLPGFESEFSFRRNSGGFRPNRPGRASFSNSTDLRFIGVALDSEMRLDSMLVTEAYQRNREEDAVAEAVSKASQNSVMTRPLLQLATDWRAYQTLDVIVARQSLLPQLKENPAIHQAIRHWILLGGIMVVIDSHDGNSTSNPTTNISAAMAGLGITNVAEQALQQQVGRVAEDLTPSWSNQRNATQSLIQSIETKMANPPGKRGSVSTIDSPIDLPQHYDWDPNQTDQQNRDRFLENLSLLNQALNRTDRQWNQRMWVRHAGAGRVFGVRGHPETGNVESTDFEVIEKMISYLVSPMLRRGVDPMIGDTRFRDWLIPGVAQPPVYTFIGLLTVFVVLVGPIAYRWTTRHHRSHLMFLIAPALALVTTALMFAYGIMSDGFGTSARIRQLTIVDAAGKTGVERIRSTYFSGVRPADGLK
jgi:hypothetical protein